MDAVLTRPGRLVPESSPGTGSPRTDPSPALTPSTSVTANPAFAVGQKSPRRLVAARRRFSAARVLRLTGPCTAGSIRARGGEGAFGGVFGTGLAGLVAADRTGCAGLVSGLEARL